MKKNLLMVCSALLLLYLLPLILPRESAARAEEAVSPLPTLQPRAEAPAELSSPEASQDPPPARSIRLLAGEELLELSLEDYLVGVVAAEMPVSFPEEALKAQAVAARSYALRQIGSGKHPEADLCADPGCCQAWHSEASLREIWGEDAEEKLARIRDAVAATAGETLFYAGEPVLAVFHSSSPGRTALSGQRLQSGDRPGCAGLCERAALRAAGLSGRDPLRLPPGGFLRSGGGMDRASLAG